MFRRVYPRLLIAKNEAGDIVASYPATIGSSRFPSPSGTMEVVAVAPEPNYTFTSEGREWGPEGTYILPPGPNNPVGGTWIDLAKEGYGIHGSPDPQLIAKSNSHGCVRLTNWDAAAPPTHSAFCHQPTLSRSRGHTCPCCVQLTPSGHGLHEVGSPLGESELAK